MTGDEIGNALLPRSAISQGLFGLGGRCWSVAALRARLLGLPFRRLTVQLRRDKNTSKVTA